MFDEYSGIKELDKEAYLLIRYILCEMEEKEIELFVPGIHGLNKMQLVIILKYLYESNILEYDVLEIGTWNGITAVAMGLMVRYFDRDIKVYSIDSLVGMQDCKSDRMPIENYRYNVGKLKLEKYCELIIGNSEDVEFDKEIGFLFVDGGHSYKQVKKDIEKYVPKVIKNGNILFHDYNETHPGSVQAIDEANLGGSDKECKQVYVARKK